MIRMLSVRETRKEIRRLQRTSLASGRALGGSIAPSKTPQGSQTSTVGRLDGWTVPAVTFQPSNLPTPLEFQLTQILIARRNVLKRLRRLIVLHEEVLDARLVLLRA